MKNSSIILLLTLISLLLTACGSPASQQSNLQQEIAGQEIDTTSAYAATLIIEDPTEGDDVTWPSIMVENIGKVTIDVSIDVSVIKDGSVLDKKNGVLFLTSAGGGDNIDKIYPGESVKGILNYLYQEEIKHNWKLRVELRSGASAKIIASDEKCLSASCDDESIKVTQEPVLTNAPEWTIFFEGCQKKFPPGTFKNSALAEPATDKCEHQYAADYFKPDYCEKVEDYAIRDECWIDMAIISKDKNYCEKHFKGSKVMDCIKNIL